MSALFKILSVIVLKLFRKIKVSRTTSLTPIDSVCVLRVRGHYLDKFVTVDLGRITPEGNLVPDWIKMFCVELPRHFEKVELSARNTEFCLVADEIPEQWVRFILNLPESRI